MGKYPWCFLVCCMFLYKLPAHHYDSVCSHYPKGLSASWTSCALSPQVFAHSISLVRNLLPLTPYLPTIFLVIFLVLTLCYFPWKPRISGLFTPSVWAHSIYASLSQHFSHYMEILCLFPCKLHEDRFWIYDRAQCLAPMKGSTHTFWICDIRTSELGFKISLLSLPLETLD